MLISLTLSMNAVESNVDLTNLNVRRFSLVLFVCSAPSYASNACPEIAGDGKFSSFPVEIYLYGLKET